MPEYGAFQPNMRLLPTLSLAPDGARIAYVDDTSGHFNAMIRSLSAEYSQQLTSMADATVRHVAWDTTGDHVALFADSSGNERESIYLVKARGDEDPSVLVQSEGARFVPADGPPFSPDGHWMVYAGNDRVAQDQDVVIHNLFTAEQRRVYAGGGRTFAGFWSPDSRKLTVAERRTTNGDHVVHVVSVEGNVSPICLTRQDLSHPYWLGPWLPDGSGFLVLTNLGRNFTGLAVMDATSGSLTWWDTPEWDIEEVALSQDGRLAVWNLRVDGYSQLRARDVETGRNFDLPTLPMSSATGLTLAHDGSHALLRLSTPTRPWNIAAIDLASGEIRWITNARPSNADSAIFIEPNLVRYPSSNLHRDIPAFLYRPSNTEKRVGVVLSIHGGPAWYETPSYLYDGFYQFLLSRGIGILGPNGPGSIGYGKEYQDVLDRDWGGADLQSWADAVAFLRELDWVDPDRIGVFGASYGGFAVLSCLSRLPEMNWAAGVDFYGPSNLVTLAKASPPTWRKLIEATFGDPERDAIHLMKRSPVTHADNVIAPLLVLQGANDPRVPQAESDQIVQRLRSRGVQTQYEVFPDEGHGFMRRENQQRAFSLAGEFFTRHLVK